LPSVVSASGVYPLPLSRDGWSGSIGVVGHPAGNGVPEPHAEYAVTLPGYFRTAGIQLLEGRDFTNADSAQTVPVAIVDEEFARAFWPGESALGKRVATSGDLEKGPFQTIVGVVAHTLRNGARDRGEGQLYLPLLQDAQSILYFVVRGSGDARALLAPVRAAVHDQDAQLPIARLTTGGDLVKSFTARDRFNVLLFTAFGAIALLLAAVGVYGVLASLVAQRTREIGIRLALGGRPADVVRRLVGEGTALAAIGLVAGLGAAALVGQTLTEMLFGVTPTDLTTYVLIAALVLGVTVLAAYLPARRAWRIDPIDALRD